MSPLLVKSTVAVPGTASPSPHSATRIAILNAHAKLEVEGLTREKHDLLNQRDKLLQAHYAGAVPLDQLKDEQDRISTALTQITNRLDAAQANYAEAQAELADCLDLASDCYTVYQQAPDSVRRLFNQAFFERIYITDEGEINSAPAGTFAMILDPATQSVARQRQLVASGNVQTPARTFADEGFELDASGGPKGIRTPDLLHVPQRFV